MATLSYSFCMSLLHSTWQAALLWLVYMFAEKTLKHHFAPQQKKNLLFVSLAVQLVLFVLTFLIYYSQYRAEVPGSILPVTGIAIGNILPASIIKQYCPWIFTGYSFIIAFKLLKAAREWFLFKKQFRTGLVKPPVDLKLFTTEQQFHFGIKRKVQLWLSHHIGTPLTFGFFKPVIVLPVALVNQLSLQQAETLILHELEHIRSNDFILNWFLIAAETIFFFNPFVMALCKKIKLEREKNCDIRVTAFDYPPLLYAETLLKAQTVKQLAPQLLAEGYKIAAVNKPHHLLNRIQFFTNPANQIQQRKKILLPVLSLLLMTFFAAAILVQLPKAVSKKETTYIEPVNLLPLQADGAFPVVVNNVLQNLKQETAGKIAAAVLEQEPLIEKKIKQAAPLIQDIKLKAEKLAAEFAGDNILTPVSLTENDAAKQIVIREEESGSKNAVLKVYNVIFKDGKWIIQPQWKLAAKEINPADSLLLNDTSAPAEASTEMQD